MRAGCDGKTSAWDSAVTGSVALLVTAASGLLYFDDVYGLFGYYSHLLSTIAGPCCGFLVGATVFTETWWVAHRSRVLLTVPP